MMVGRARIRLVVCAPQLDVQANDVDNEGDARGRW